MGFTPLDWKMKTAEKLDRIFADDEITPDAKYITHAEVQIAKRDTDGTASWKDALRQAIDEAKAYCKKRAELQRYLQDHFGVTMPRNTGKTVSFIHPAVGETYAIRGHKLGSDYTAASIDQALQENAERSLVNAGLHIAEEQSAAITTTAIATEAAADPFANIPIIISQSTVENGNRERIAPRSISDVGAELRSLDETVGRIAKGVQPNDDNEDGGDSTSDEPFGRNGAATLEGNDGDDRAVQPKPSEPVVETGEHESSVQPKPKRRSHYDER
jgi:hypothetical protein